MICRAISSTPEFPITTIHFNIQDTGIGMTPEQQQRLFRPFELVSNQKMTEGTGLGLAISQSFVKFMGGEIQVYSEFGVGSKFSFELDFPTAKDWVKSKHSELILSALYYSRFRTNKV